MLSVRLLFHSEESVVLDFAGSVMSQGTVKPSQGLVGACDLPGDANMSVMALVLSSSADGISRIHRCSRRPEVERTGVLLSELGITVAWDGETATVTGGDLLEPDDELHAGGSLVLFSCLAGLLSNAPFVTRLSGVRADTNVDRVFEALRALGAHLDIRTEDRISAGVGGGKLTPGSYRIGLPVLAVKCGMLMAGLGVDGTVELVQETGGDDDLEVLLQAAGCGLKKRRMKGAGGHQAPTLEY